MIRCLAQRKIKKKYTLELNTGVLLAFQKKRRGGGGNKRAINEPSNNIANVFENHDKF